MFPFLLKIVITAKKADYEQGTTTEIDNTCALLETERKVI
jgi:hypothetical protein